MPEETGIYAEPILNAFMRGHLQEDWYIKLTHPHQNDGINEDGYMIPNVLEGNIGTDVGRVHWESIYVTRSRRDRNHEEYKYKLCGISNQYALRVTAPFVATHRNDKFVCYSYDRNFLPGFPNYFPVAEQFYRQQNFHLLAFENPIFATVIFESGFIGSDGVQSIFKGNQTLELKDNNKGVNLALRTNDYFKSERSGQVDIAFPYKSISLTSNDLLAVPERTGDANTLQPILSSYTIPTIFDAGASTSGKIQSFTSTPYGTVTFSEGGTRRYHQLSAIPGGMRQFTVQCVLDPKDDKQSKTLVKLPPGGRFSCQFVFVRKV